jgi:ketosteroid isomerase-like protein
MYDCFGKGDMETIRREIFHPEVTWRMPGHHPLSATMRGVDEVLAFFQALFTAGIKVDNAHFGTLDDGTVIEKHVGHGMLEGKEFLFPTATSYGIKDGKIFDVQVHTGDQHTVNRYMWAGFQLKPIPDRLQMPVQVPANVQMVLRMYDCFGKGDMDTIRNEIFDPEIVWRMPGHHPLSGDMTGVDEVLAFFGDLFRAGIVVDNVHFGLLDDGSVIEKHTGHGKIGDEEFVFPTATSYVIANGKIRSVQVHTGDQHTVDRYMWTVFKLRDIQHRLERPSAKVWHYH